MDMDIQSRKTSSPARAGIRGSLRCFSGHYFSC